MQRKDGAGTSVRPRADQVTAYQEKTMTPNVGGIDRTLRIVAGIALLSLFFVLEGNARYWGLIGIVPILTGHLPLVPGVPAFRHQHLLDEERLRLPAANPLPRGREWAGGGLTPPRWPPTSAASKRHPSRRPGARPRARP